MTVCDLGRASSVVCAEQFRTVTKSFTAGPHTPAVLVGRDGPVADRVAGAELNWRCYLLRYPCMREGNSGIYYGADHALGYELTMLRKNVQHSWYRDPYLSAIWRERLSRRSH
jgi:hypothetical protein